MSNGLTSEYIPGAWNAICDGCGAQFKNFQLRKDWKGLYKCTRCWEPRQTQDFVRGVPDKMQTEWTRQPPADVFVSSGHSAVAGVAIAGKAIVNTPF